MNIRTIVKVSLGLAATYYINGELDLALAYTAYEPRGAARFNINALHELIFLPLFLALMLFYLWYPERRET